MKLVRTLAAATTVIALAVVAPLSASAAGVDPAMVQLTLEPGASASFAVHVTTPAIVPKPDIVLLADTTGSMDPALANVRDNVATIMGEVRAAQPDARFGVAEYKEQVDANRVFTVDTPLTDDPDAVVNGTQQWLFNVGGGGQPWTDFINAHHRLATDAVTWRPAGSRIILWFGDARSHDPSLGHTMADTVNALRSLGARVVAVPVVGTSGDGLDQLGQATTIVNATTGVLMPATSTDEVADALLAGLRNLTVPVTASPVCDPELSLTFSPATRTVRSGTEATFAATASVRSDAVAGTYHCTVDYQVNGVGAGLTQAVTVTVPSAAPSLSVSDVSVAEGSTGTSPAVFTVSLSAPSSSPVSVHAATADGTASSQSDFTATAVDLTFAPGETSKPVSVPVAGDTVTEPDETFALQLSGASGASIADESGVGTILDDDQPRSIGVSDVSVAEGNSGTASAVFTVSLSGPASGPVTVQAATADGTATSPADFTATAVTVTFAPGETSKPVAVPVAGDANDEQDETFLLQLTAASGATIADGSGVGTILDDDDGGSEAQLSVGDVAVTEGDSGTRQAVFLISLDRGSSASVTGRAVTSDGTATSPSDFTATGSDFTIPAGQRHVEVGVPVLGDTADEQDETFTLELTGVRGAVVSDGQGVGTILDDDEPAVVPEVSIGDVTVAEGNTGATSAVFTVSLSGPSSGPVTVHAATADGTATSPSDFTVTDVDLTFAPGETSKPVSVPVIGDTVVEPDETFSVGLSGAEGASIADEQAVGTIRNDDVEPPRLSIGDVTVPEGAGTAVFTVTLNQASGTAASVHYATAAGTATAGQDFSTVGGDLQFPPGQTARQISVPISGDSVDELAETFTIQLSGTTGATIVDGTGVGTITDDDRDGRFLCRASAITVLGSEPVVANPAGAPCADAARAVPVTTVGTPLLGVRLTGGAVRTDQVPDDLAGAGPANGDSATATTELGTTRITAPGLTVEVGAITARASARCVPGNGALMPSLAGSPTIGSLRINGIPVPIGNGPVTIPLLVGTLRLNATTATGSTVTQRAVELHTLLGDVVLGEARAGVQGTSVHPQGSPCIR